MSDRRAAIFRSGARGNKRVFVLAWDAVQDESLSLEAVGLLARLISRPRDWEVVLRQIVSSGQCKRDKLHRIMRELRDRGYVVMDPQRDELGRFRRGIYLVTDDPDSVELDGAEPVDIPAGKNQDADGASGSANDDQPDPGKPDAGDIKESITADIELKRASAPAEPRIGAACYPPDAEQRPIGDSDQPAAPQGAAKSCLPEEVERRRDKARSRCLPDREQAKNERRSRGAKGSAVKGGRGAGGMPNNVRITGRMQRQLIAAAGPCLAPLDKSPGLTSTAIPIMWLDCCGYDWDEDVLACIRAKAPGIEDGRIVTWRYFDKALAEWHKRRTGQSALPKDMPLPEGMAGLGELCRSIAGRVAGRVRRE